MSLLVPTIARKDATNPKDFPQLFQDHKDYKRHISNIINMKA